MLRALSVPASNERGPLYMDQVLAAVHQGNSRRLPITLAMMRYAGEVTLCSQFSAELEKLFEGQVYAQYPDAKLIAMPDDALDVSAEAEAWYAHLTISHDLFPIKRYVQFEDALNRQLADPLSAILTALPGNVDQMVELTIRPARRRRTIRARRCLRRLAQPFFRTHHRLAHIYIELALSRAWPLRVMGWLLSRLAHQGGAIELRPLDTSGSRQHDREEDLQSASDKLGKLLFETSLRIRVAGADGKDARRRVREVAGAFGQFNSRHAGFHLGRVRKEPRRFREATFLCSTEEIASLWHPPTATVRAPTMSVVESREAEPPVRLPTPNSHPGLAVLGLATFRSREQVCGILPDDRRRHVYIAGKTGMGKSTLLHRLISSDISAGRGVGLVDPHGDLCEAVLASVPRFRTNDVILFDAGDAEFPLAFNMFACARPEQRPLVASGIIAAFKKMYGEFWGPRMEHILRNSVLALLEVPGTSLLSLLRLLSEPRFREAVVGRVSDPLVRAFWQREFAGWPSRLQAEAVAPVQNKIGHFLSNPLLRNILGQSRSTLNLRTVLDKGKVLLVNLSKGRIGEDASTLLGSFLVTALQLAAMSRADLPEDRRSDFYCYVDEFQNYSTESFATILSEARKYRLNLTVANQYLAQVEEETLSAVFGNVGTLICFAVGVQDAEVLAEQLGGDLTPKDLMALPCFQAYVRLLIHGQPRRPFSMRTLPPPEQHDQNRPHVIRHTSRRRYARPAPQVERDIERAFATV